MFIFWNNSTIRPIRATIEVWRQIETSIFKVMGESSKGLVCMKESSRSGTMKKLNNKILWNLVGTDWHSQSLSCLNKQKQYKTS